MLYIPNDIPTGEVGVYICIATNRTNLYRFYDNFRRAVELFRFLKPGGAASQLGSFYIPFRIIAARDSALNIFHFGCTLDAIRKQFSMCPTLARTQRGDPEKIKQAVKLFNRHFPHADAIRHAIAHAGELQKNPKQMKRNAQKGPAPQKGVSYQTGGLLISALHANSYSVGIEGNVFSVVMEDGTATKLREVIKAVSHAFSALEEEAKRAPGN
jgi:hypothetical protein